MSSLDSDATYADSSSEDRRPTASSSSRKRKSRPAPSTSRPFGAPAKRSRKGRARAEASDPTDRLTTATHQAEHSSAGRSYLSTRPDPTERNLVPPLTTLALDKFAKQFRQVAKKLSPLGRSSDPEARLWEEGIQRLPPHLSERLLSTILSHDATQLTPEQVATLFFHSTTTSLNFSTTSVVPSFLINRLSNCPNLRRLDLRNQVGLKSRDLAPALKGLPLLEELLVPGCVNINDTVLQALSSATEDRLRVVNLNLTAVTTRGLISLLARCKNLEVLKLGSINGLKDAAVAQLVDRATDLASGWRHVPLSRLKTLKLKGTQIGDVGLGRLLNLCAPTLERLDVSWTEVQRLDVLRLALFPHSARDEAASQPPSPSKATTPLSVPPPTSTFETQLRKLCLSGLPLIKDKTRAKLGPLRSDTLLAFFSAFAAQPLHVRSPFHTLRLGSIGVSGPRGPADSPFSSNVIRDHLTGDRLEALLPCLFKLVGLRNVSLAGNYMLGGVTTGSGDPRPLEKFMATVGRRCEWLDLGDVPNVNAQVLGGIIDYHDATLSLAADAGPSESAVNVLEDEEAVPRRPRLRQFVLDKTRVGDDAAEALASCPELRKLFLRDTKISASGLTTIMRGCPHLQVLDLTSCRGVPLAQRRDFFTAWDDDEVEA